jgi:hypothetical protein
MMQEARVGKLPYLKELGHIRTLWAVRSAVSRGDRYGMKEMAIEMVGKDVSG